MDVNRLDHSGIDELANGRFRYADVAAYASKPDTALSYEPPYESWLYIFSECFGSLIERQEPFIPKVHVSYRFSCGWLSTVK